MNRDEIDKLYDKLLDLHKELKKPNVGTKKKLKTWHEYFALSKKLKDIKDGNKE